MTSANIHEAIKNVIKVEFEKIKEGMVERVKKMKDFAFVHFKVNFSKLNTQKKALAT